MNTFLNNRLLEPLLLVLVLKMWYIKQVYVLQEALKGYSQHLIIKDAGLYILLSHKDWNISAAFKDCCLGSVSFLANEVVTKSARFSQDYERYRDEVANGLIGKTV